MIYGSIRVNMGQYGLTWVVRGEKSNVKNVKIIISGSDFFREREIAGAGAGEYDCLLRSMVIDQINKLMKINIKIIDNQLKYMNI